MTQDEQFALLREGMKDIRENMVRTGELKPWQDDVQRQLGVQSAEVAAVEERANKRIDGVIQTQTENDKIVKSAASARVNMWIVGGIAMLVSVAGLVLGKVPWP